MRVIEASVRPAARWAAALFVTGALAGACSRSSAAGATLVLTGSSTVAPLAAEIAKRFERLHPGVRIDVQTGGSARGIADALSGAADIGMVSRALTPGERRSLVASTIAYDGVCLIVHADNPIRSLTDEQVVAIYEGRIRNWRQVGGRDAPITVVHKAEGRATLELFLAYFGLDNARVAPSVVIGDNEQGIRTVAGDPNAIGYVSIGNATYDAEHGVAIKLLPVAGVPATLAEVAAGRFPIARELNLVTRGEPRGLARAFIEFARSEAVHDLVRAQFYVPADAR